MSASQALLEILDLARWAPSGDNTQNWRFEILGDSGLRVHGFDTRSHCVYDLDGRPSQISIGALLETLSVAASTKGRRAQIQRIDTGRETELRFDIQLPMDSTIAPSPLATVVKTRSVQRRPLERRAATEAELAMLRAAAGTDHEFLWFGTPRDRRRFASLLFHSAKLRLTTPEAYAVHSDIIEWGCQFSATKVPDQALGADALTLKLMQWVMQSWPRVRFFNRYFAGTLMPRIQLDWIPAVWCAGHFLLVADHAPTTVDDYVAGGRAAQRVWLTATHLGLQLQPEVTPLVFSRYARGNRQFSEVKGSLESAEAVRHELQGLIGADIEGRAVFMGRIGAGSKASARSTRRPLEELLITPDSP